MRVVLAIPVCQPFELKVPSSAGWPASFSQEAAALSRQVSRFGNKAYMRSKIRTLNLPKPGLKFNSNINLVRGVVIEKRNRVSLFVGTFECSASRDLDGLRRLAKADNSKLFMEKLGLVPNSENSVYGLSIAQVANTHPSARDGNLRIPKAESDFVFDVIYMQTLGAIAFEREIIEQATLATFYPGFLNLRALSHLGRIKHWLSYPSSDSTRMYEEISLLRRSLDLDSRRNQVTSSLDQHTKQLAYSGTVFGLTLGSSLSIFGGKSFTNSYFGLSSPFTSLLLALIAASVTWLISRS